MKETKEEQKFICPKCKDIVTEKDILDECANGGMGMCMCEYMAEDPDTGDVWFPRTLIPYIKLEDYKRREKQRILDNLDEIKRLVENSNFD